MPVKAHCLLLSLPFPKTCATTVVMSSQKQKVLLAIEDAMREATRQEGVRRSAAAMGVCMAEIHQEYKHKLEDLKDSVADMLTPVDPAVLAERFHEAYERLAPDHGYETRVETRVFDPETMNGKLMIAVCTELFG